MLTKFAAALLATSLIAGSALAAQPSATPAANGTGPAVQTQTPSKPAVNATTPAARHRHHVRKHVARSKGNALHHARHAKPAKTHQAGMSKSKSTKRS